jgi:hypothetical protein
VQYDTASESVGINTRLRWTFAPVGDLFVVSNHNVRDIFDRWLLDSNQLLVKLPYALRYQERSMSVTRRLAAAGIAGSVCLLLPLHVRAQISEAPAPFEIVAARATRPPLIDGEIGDSEWQGAAMASNFIQYEPQRGDRSDVRTEVIVLYDAGHLYIAFRAWDSEPVTA